MQRLLYIVSWTMLLIAMLAFLVGVWNTDWVRMEKGYYTMVVWLIFISIFLTMKIYMDREQGIYHSFIYMGVATASTIASIIWGVVSISNTEWPLYLKAYFWLCIGLLAFATFIVSIEIRKREQVVLDNEELIEDVPYLDEE